MGQQFTITLPDDLTQFVREQVENGAYASVDELVGDLLRNRLASDSVAAKDDDVERWLRRDVVPSLQRMKAEPGRGRSPEQVKLSLELALRNGVDVANQA